MTSVSTALKETEAWPLDEQLELMHRMWDRLLDSGWQPELTDELRAELDRRLDELDAHPENTVSWEELVANLRRSK